MSARGNATLTDASATGTITDDDAAPTLAVADASAAEDAGEIVFAVTLTGRTVLPVTVDWATAPGTATAGEDYESAAGTLTLNPGETRGALSVAVRADALYEGVETFSVALSGSTNATLADASVMGTITDDDAGTATVHWLSRFGRTVAGHIVDAVDERLNGPAPATHLTAVGRLDWAGNPALRPWGRTPSDPTLTDAAADPWLRGSALDVSSMLGSNAAAGKLPDRYSVADKACATSSPAVLSISPGRAAELRAKVGGRFGASAQRRGFKATTAPCLMTATC